jgi:membrane-associated phospholipid phosphatase
MKIGFFLLFFVQFALAQPLEVKWLDQINGHYTQTGGVCMKATSESITPVSFGIPLAYIAIGVLKKDKAIQYSGLTLLATQATNGILTTGLKMGVHRERPFNAYPTLITKYGKGGSYSFPSGHTSTAFAFATTMTLNDPHWYIAVPCYSYACLVGYSRMYLGVHYPSDVLAGAIVGTASAFGTYYLMKWIQKKTHHPSIGLSFNNGYTH